MKSSSGMCLFVYLFELFKGGVGVNFGCGQAFVAEQLLHGFDVGVVVEHGGGKRVAQHVWRTLLYRSNEGEELFTTTLTSALVMRVPRAVTKNAFSVSRATSLRSVM